MTELKSTPGPWSYIGEDDDDFVVYAGEQYIANIGGERIRPAQFPVNGVVAFDIRDQAIARLVAAAPDLYAALEAAEEHLDYCGYGDNWERECAAGLPMQIATALAKARGET